MDCDLTICTVAFNSGPRVALNRVLTQALNPDTQPTWVVIENSPEQSALRVVPDGNPRLIVLDGPPVDADSARPRSLHHGAALNLALAQVRTRFALILDPDFYVVRSDWIRGVLEFMRAGQLAFFGVPWHPRWYVKPRYFACVHCLFIDTGQVPVGALDFRPGSGGLGNEEHWSQRLALIAGNQPGTGRDGLRAVSTARRCVRRLGRAVIDCVDNIVERRAIQTSQDTGYHVYRFAKTRPALRSACAQPVFRLSDDSEARGPALMSMALDWFLPDRLSYIPKISGSFTTIGFADLGYDDMRAHGWEEFVWQGKPFGFHLRGQKQASDGGDGATVLEKVVLSWAHSSSDNTGAWETLSRQAG